MKTINGITITDAKAKRLMDGKIFEVIVPSEIGYFSSLMYLKELGYDPSKFVERALVDNNPHKFEYLTTQELSDEFIDNTPYEEALKLQDDEGYVYSEGFGKIHINNWKIKEEQDMKKLICENCKSIHEEGSKRCYCGSTTLSPTHESNKTDREKAMEWWNGLLTFDLDKTCSWKKVLSNQYYRREPNSLTGREIEHIWNMETVWKKQPEEEFYTKEEVERLIMQSHIARNRMKNPMLEVPEWVENNL